MKLIILLTTFMLSMGMAHAKDYTVINMSSKASPAGVFAQAVKKSLKADWYQSSNCEDASRAFNDTENAIMVYNSSVAFAALNKKLQNCQLDQAKKVVLISESRMLLCTRPGETKKLTSDDVTLGMASMYAVSKHEQQFNGNVKIIPYSGSKTVLRALRAGDIDWGWMGESLALKQKDKIQCHYSTEPSSGRFLGYAIPSLVIPDFRIAVVVYTNGEPNSIAKQLQSNEDFIKYLVSSKNNYSFDNKNTNLVQKYVQRMYDNWKD